MLAHSNVGESLLAGLRRGGRGDSSPALSGWWVRAAARYAALICTGVALRQGLTLVHSSAQLEPCLTQKNTLHTLNTP